MSPLQITLIVIVVLVAVTALLTYFTRNKYYRQIDELDAEKNDVLKQAPYDELKEVAELNIVGQSQEFREKLEDQWRSIETLEYPNLENYLFDAEQATDRYRLGESKRNQEAAEEAIGSINQKLSDLREGLTELIEREQANLEKIDLIKKRYHEVRKSLLAYSFSFGPASESFEEKLRLMEDDFAAFSDHTVSGDHEEAKEVVRMLSQDIQETEEEMERIPPLLELIDEVYAEELKDLQYGYDQMVEAGYLFPEDTIETDIRRLEQDKELIYDRVRLLELDKAQEETDELAKNIEKLYVMMENEVQAKPDVADLLEDTKRALLFLQEENRRLVAAANRIAQSYILNHEEPEKIKKIHEQLKEDRENYDVIEDRVKHQAVPYSVAYDKLDEMFDSLEGYYEEYEKVSDNLENYRAEERELKNDMLEMEQEMYSLKRRLENERLPGLPNNYLELFFSTSDRIEHLSAEISRPKIQLIDIRRIHSMCTEDVAQLQDMTDDLIRQVELTERVSQRLYRYKDSHKGILETIRYSESLFSDDYDYDTALRLVREKLENVDPGSYQEIVETYEQEKAEEDVNV